MKYLLDTNVFREIGKQQPHVNVRAWLATVDDADLAVSVLTVREVTKGIIKLRVSKPEVATAIETRVAAIFAAFEGRILPVDRAVAAAWGQMLAEHERYIDDTALAATASVRGLVLATRNVRHVLGRGVVLIDPYKQPPETIKP